MVPQARKSAGEPYALAEGAAGGELARPHHRSLQFENLGYRGVHQTLSINV